MINFDIISNIDYKCLGYMELQVIPPIGTHIIYNSKEMIIIDYILVDYDINTYKAIVRQANNNDRLYKDKV